MLSFFFDGARVVEFPGNSLLPACKVASERFVVAEEEFEKIVSSFGSIVLVKFVSFVISTFEVLSVPKLLVDFLVDLSLEEIVAGVFGLLESEFAPVSAAVISFDFKKLFFMILSRVEKS